MRILVNEIQGEYGPREVWASKTKNFEGKECLKGHGIKRGEEFVRISNSFGADDSIICEFHAREKGWVE